MNEVWSHFSLVPLNDIIISATAIHRSFEFVLVANVGLIVGLVLMFVLIVPAAIIVAAFFAYRHREKLKKIWNGRPYKYRYVSVRLLGNYFLPMASVLGAFTMTEKRKRTRKWYRFQMVCPEIQCPVYIKYLI